MSRARAFFVEEARECLATARAELAADIPSPAGLHAAVRRLRGSAQLARFGQPAAVAGALEARLKPVARGQAGWTEELADTARAAFDRLDALVDAIEAGRVPQDSRSDVRMDMQDRVGQEEWVDVAELEYSGEAALDRALELREALENAIVAEEPTGSILDELFDLIRLGRR